MDSQLLTEAFETYLRGTMFLNEQVEISIASTDTDWETVRSLRKSFGGLALHPPDLNEVDFRGVVYIASVDGMAVGTIRVMDSRQTRLPELIRHPWREALLCPNTDYVEVGKLVVHPRHRTFAVSAALIRAVMVYTAQSNAQGILLTCLDSLVNYYTRMGFRLVDSEVALTGPRNLMLLDDGISPMFTVLTSLTRAMMAVYGSSFTVPAHRR